MNPTIVAVSSHAKHAFSKTAQDAIELREGLGVAGDAHAGATVQHLSRIARNPDAPNLRQVHLIHAELFDELRAKGHSIKPGDLGENITTRGLDLLGLGTGTVLRLGDDAEIEITGLRNPCGQIERFQAGLLAAVLDRDIEGNLIRKAGVMAIVRKSGVVRAGGAIVVAAPPGPFAKLAPV